MPDLAREQLSLVLIVHSYEYVHKDYIKFLVTVTRICGLLVNKPENSANQNNQTADEIGQLNNFLNGHTKYFAAIKGYIALLIVSSYTANAVSYKLVGSYMNLYFS